MRDDRPGFYCGDDALNLGWLAHGGVGVVSVVGHVAGGQYAAMIAAVDAATSPSARAIDQDLSRSSQRS